MKDPVYVGLAHPLLPTFFPTGISQSVVILCIPVSMPSFLVKGHSLQLCKICQRREEINWGREERESKWEKEEKSRVNKESRIKIEKKARPLRKEKERREERRIKEGERERWEWIREAVVSPGLCLTSPPALLCHVLVAVMCWWPVAGGRWQEGTSRRPPWGASAGLPFKWLVCSSFGNWRPSCCGPVKKIRGT